MKIKSNLNLISLLPITLVIFLGGYILFNEYNNFQKVEDTKAKIEEIKNYKNILLEFSKERGLSTINLLQTSSDIQSKLVLQREIVNQNIQNILNLRDNDNNRFWCVNHHK